ncbi:MAG: hypothetical protein K6T78_14710 [Alicyclobacillus sp.]|nr:hypothetical protein [Alicyclobacillus sp.]
MGEVRLGFGVPHAPQFITRPESEDPAQLQAIDETFAECRRQIDEIQPDAIILLSNDHLENYFLDNVPPFLVVTGKEAEGEYGDNHVRIRLNEDLSKKFLYYALDNDFDLSYSHKFFLGHSFVIPLKYLDPEGKYPALVLSVNTYWPPQPTASRAFALGRLLGTFLRQQPGKYVVVASGGLSHFPGTPDYSHPRNEFDKEFMAIATSGHLERIAGYSREELDAMGNLELLSWAIMAGTLGPCDCEVMTYQPSWHHGYTIMRCESRELAQPHYQMASPDKYDLNATLRDLMLVKNAQDAFLADAASYVETQPLSDEEKEAVRNLELDRLAALGANPFVAFMANLNLRFAARKRVNS